VIDRRDPFGSGLPLALVDVSGSLKPGANEIEVTYSGNLKLFVTVDHKRWKTEPVGDARLKASRTLDRTTAGVGETLNVTLRLSGNGIEGGVAIDEPLASNTIVDPESLATLKRQGVISDYSVGDRLRFYLPALDRPVTFSYRLVAVRAGEATLGATVVRPLSRPEQARFLVAPVRLVVR